MTLQKGKYALGVVAVSSLTFVSGYFLQGAEAETITSQDDGTLPVKAVPFVVETPSITTQQYSINDLTSEITAINAQITTLQARRDELVALQTKIQKEADKLSPR